MAVNTALADAEGGYIPFWKKSTNFCSESNPACGFFGTSSFQRGRAMIPQHFDLLKGWCFTILFYLLSSPDPQDLFGFERPCEPQLCGAGGAGTILRIREILWKLLPNRVFLRNQLKRIDTLANRPWA